jgi:hypothetical protein
MYQIHHTWIHSLYHSPLFPPPQILRTVSTAIIFAFTHMCKQYSQHIHLLHPFSATTTPSLGRTCSALLFPSFVEENRIQIYLLKLETQANRFLMLPPRKACYSGHLTPNFQSHLERKPTGNVIFQKNNLQNL